MNLNEISYRIRGAVFDVYNELGPGWLEKVYEQALIIELQNKELQVQNQVPIEVLYKGFDLDLQYRLDLLVNEQLLPLKHWAVGEILKSAVILLVVILVEG